MDFGRAFKYPFDDPEKWKKVIIMGLITLIPVLGQLVLVGWMVDVVKKVIHQEDTLLPDLDFGGQLSRGFGAFVISLVYAIPILILVGIQTGITTGGSLMMGNGSDNSNAALGVGVTLVVICFSLIYFVYGILIGFMLPIAYGRYAEFGKVGEGLKFGVILGMVRKALGPVFIALLGSWVASLVGSLGSVACGIGVLVTIPYAMAVTAHFYGQAYNHAKMV